MADAGASAPSDQAPSSSGPAAATADLLRLEVTAGPCSGVVFTRPGDLVTVGRTSKSKVHIKDAAVSEKHATLAWERARWVLRDVGSSNGTAVNGKRVQEGEAVVLKDGDVVLFGTDSEVKVQVSRAVDEAVTVEQDLRAECKRWVQRLTAQGEQMANSLHRQWHQAKATLLAAE
ncbi:hypothetical protein WJX81_007006 [Elliptochloris bilobata]|uniref:FHA domain-containing protein n=1 Tax=Elliptochloris bilobata TaxID=381761 RepID=A0AAW1QM14_9CHLO